MNEMHVMRENREKLYEMTCQFTNSVFYKYFGCQDLKDYELTILSD